MTIFDAFNWAFENAIRNCGEKRLDPPSDRAIACLYCQGHGYFKQAHCGAPACEKRRYCPCPCQHCTYVECDVCEGVGEISEPEEWRDDAYWEAKYDEERGL